MRLSSCFFEVLKASEPLSYRCAGGILEESLAAEDARFREELRALSAQFVGLGGRNSLRWCELQVLRASELHLSCLHRLQELRKDFEELPVDLRSPTEEKQKEWLQQEAQITEARRMEERS